MQTLQKFSVAVSTAVLALGVSSGSSQAATLINFESDTIGEKPNVFISASSPLVRFSDSSGGRLIVDNFGNQTIGKGLVAFGNGGNNSLILNFSQAIDSLSLVFGNDDPAFSSPGLKAKLEIFSGLNAVISVFLAANRNDIADQTISFSGRTFDRAIFTYVEANGTPSNLFEAVDNVSFNVAARPVPVPGAIFGVVVAGGALVARQRKKAKVNQTVA